tara:strand:- start:569 stop:1060 length:492 start_codon:yes stop_codon:yes gene_type:complete
MGMYANSRYNKAIKPYNKRVYNSSGYATRQYEDIAYIVGKGSARIAFDKAIMERTKWNYRVWSKINWRTYAQELYEHMFDVWTTNMGTWITLLEEDSEMKHPNIKAARKMFKNDKMLGTSYAHFVHCLDDMQTSMIASKPFSNREWNYLKEEEIDYYADCLKR